MTFCHSHRNITNIDARDLYTVFCGVIPIVSQFHFILTFDIKFLKGKTDISILEK